MDNVIAHEKTLEMTVLMTPEMVNFSGKVHGGAILKLLDQVAYACAARYSGHYVVTLSVDQVFFRHPVHVGELVTFLANTITSQKGWYIEVSRINCTKTN